MSIIYVVYNYKYNYISQVNMFYWMYAYQRCICLMYRYTQAPIGLHTLYVGLVYACLRTFVLHELSVALVPCILAAMPSNHL